LLEKIKAEHTASRGLYGSPKLYRKLRREGETVNHKRVERLMKEHGITAKRARKFTRTTTSRHSLPVADNVLPRNFSVECPNAVWTSDITYLWTAEGWLYLAVFIDLYSRLVVGWAVSDQLHTALIAEAFTIGQMRRGGAVAPLVHSDIGAANMRVRHSENAWRRGTASRA
jgi:putative transposase